MYIQVIQPHFSSLPSPRYNLRVRALERTHTGTRSWYARSRCLCPSVYTSVRMMGANAPYFIHDVQSFEYKSDNIIDVG